MNCPFPAGSGRREILGAVENRLLPADGGFRPDLVLISAGFDSREGDLLGRFTLTDEDFADLTRAVMEIAGSTRRPGGLAAGGRLQFERVGFRSPCSAGAARVAVRRRRRKHSTASSAPRARRTWIPDPGGAWAASLTMPASFETMA